MNTIVATLNAKYIHTSLAVRLLYVANKDRLNIAFKEYTIKESISSIAEDLLAHPCDVVGLGVYIWNVRQTQQLVDLLKQVRPELIIILGGPEVTYEPDFFIRNWPIDYVISGEGEFVLGDLVQALAEGESTEMEGVSSETSISHKIVQADLNRLAALDSPYMLNEDSEQRRHKLIYFESARGCPYQCQYCLSSLEKGVRYFPEAYIVKNLAYLINHGAEKIKFLDRTFNLNKHHTQLVFDFLLQHHQTGLNCQFEIYADLLKEETIEYLNANVPTDFFRFEIGIQSTYEPTNQAVKRKQNFPLVANNIKLLRTGGKIDLHLDLIAGLPYETFDRFVQSFNDVFALGAKEVQLGFLKMLRGTTLRKNADRYGYVYDLEAPYEIRCNAAISEDELHRIHEAEHALEKYWNSGRFSRTMQALFDTHYAGRYFELFDEIGRYYQQHQYPHHGYQLEDLFRILQDFLLTKGIQLPDVLRTDYYNNFKIRPTGSWDQTINKKVRKQLLYRIGQDKAFLSMHRLTRQTIEKQTALDFLAEDELLLTIFNQVDQGPLSIRYKIVEK